MLLITLEDGNGSTKNSYITFPEHYKQHTETIVYIYIK